MSYETLNYIIGNNVLSSVNRMATYMDQNSLDEEIKNIIYYLYDFKAQQNTMKGHLALYVSVSFFPCYLGLFLFVFSV